LQSVTINPNNYPAYIGSNLSITCYGALMTANDIVWEYYPTSSQSPITVIYSQLVYQNGLNSAYSIANYVISGNVVSVLTILSVDYNNSLSTFKCECNRLTACGSFGASPPSTTATVSILSKLTHI
jgi:hypothetical protein